VLTESIAEEGDDAVGPEGRHDPDARLRGASQPHRPPVRVDIHRLAMWRRLSRAISMLSQSRRDESARGLQASVCRRRRTDRTAHAWGPAHVSSPRR
jgi:hypothetical protein